MLGKVIISAICGASWMVPLPWLGPALSLVFVLLVLAQKSRKARFFTALAYYAAGSLGLLRGVAVFFGAHAPLWEGALLWLGSSAFLATGWTFANKPWKAALVLLLDALVPPMAFFDWMSPLSAAGILFPRLGLLGVFLLCLWVALGKPRHQMHSSIIEILLVVAIFANIAAFLHPKTPPLDWKGVSLHVGPAVPNVLQNMARHQAILRETLAQAKGACGIRSSHTSLLGSCAFPKAAKVVLLPETLETDWAGNAWAIQQAIPKQQVWLVGMSVPRKPGLLTDSIVAFRHTGMPRILFNSAFPVPVSMWHPWSQGTGYVESQHVGYAASWWEPTKTIEGVKAWASICYDQLLPFVWTEALIQRPQVVLLTNNEWWAKHTGIPTIQHNTAWAWGRLLGTPEIEAENY